MISAELLQVIACPRCHGELTPRDAPAALDCPRCGLRYPITDGIPVMLIDEALPIP